MSLDTRVSELVLEPRSLTEELAARAEHLRIFVSSHMRGGVFARERAAAAQAIEATAFARAWYWERDAHAGPYCSEAVCLQYAGTSDGLVLLLGAKLTDITRAEYEVAYRRGVPVFVFVDERVSPEEAVEDFIASEAQRITYKKFRNVSELKTHITNALLRYTVRSVRTSNYAAAGRRRPELST